MLRKKNIQIKLLVDLVKKTKVHQTTVNKLPGKL